MFGALRFTALGSNITAQKTIPLSCRFSDVCVVEQHRLTRMDTWAPKSLENLCPNSTRATSPVQTIPQTLLSAEQLHKPWPQQIYGGEDHNGSQNPRKIGHRHHQSCLSNLDKKLFKSIYHVRSGRPGVRTIYPILVSVTHPSCYCLMPPILKPLPT